ncbi:tetraspanin-36-like [Linepithema humile]|uniref:tetraspanin-36-like n=1 Tax=Linepithema humile TaxID=83485 RepID=UPI00062326A4|nr:PREDICTED: leukocyte surface antigen CD53-like [Linepithema humile]
MGRLLACFRYCLLGDTILLGLSGIAVSLFAGYFIYQLYEYPLTPSNVHGPPITLLAMGVITCVIGWFSWQFMNFSNKGQVIIFTVVLAIIMLVEIGVGIWALVRHERINYKSISFAHHEKTIALAITDQKHIWDHMQAKLQCCGIDGSNDYRGISTIPWSCCNMNMTDGDNVAGSCVNLYKHGCQHVVLNRTRSILLYIFLVALGSVLLQVSFLACTTCYARIYRDEKKKTRMSLQNSRELDTKDNLLSHRLNLRSTEAVTPAARVHYHESQKMET